MIINLTEQGSLIEVSPVIIAARQVAPDLSFHLLSFSSTAKVFDAIKVYSKEDIYCVDDGSMFGSFFSIIFMMFDIQRQGFDAAVDFDGIYA